MNRPHNSCQNLVRRTACIIVAALSVAAAGQSCLAQDHIDWQRDFDKAKQLAASQDKLVLLHFTASWCQPCKELERFVFVNPMAIRAISSQVVPVKVDIDIKKNIAEEYDVTKVPFDVVITPAGHVLSSRKSPRSSDGYLQMFEQAKLASTRMTSSPNTQLADLKQQDRKMRAAAAEAKEQVSSYGAVAADQINQFKPRESFSPHVKAPEFQNPKPWSKNGSMVGVTPNTEAESAFQPSGQFKPAIPKANPFRQVAAPAAPVIKNPHVNASAAGQRLADNAAGNGQFKPPTSNNSHVNIGTHNQPFITSSKPKQQVTGPVVIKNPMVQAKPAATADTPLALQDAGKAMASTGTNNSNTSPPLGLNGYCGVSLIDGQAWTKGDRRWGCIHRGKLYLFASQAKREQFRMAPDMYSPLLGGSDPVAFQTTGELLEGQRKFGVFYGEETEQSVIILFANQQNRDQFESDPAQYLKSVREAMSRLDNGLKLR